MRAWPITVSGLRCEAGAVATRGEGQAWVTLVAKQRVHLVAEGDATRAPTPPLELRERRRGASPLGSPLWPWELAPATGRASVVVLGSACSASPTPTSRVRLVVSGAVPKLDKALHVYGDRERLGDAPTPFTSMPIIWERTVGGRGTDNPAGEPASQRLPNVVSPSAPHRPASLAPRSIHWPRGAVHPTAPSPSSFVDPALAFEARGELVARSDALAERYRVAADDQELAALDGDEWLMIEGMTQGGGWLRSRLPSARAEARVVGRGGEQALALPLELVVLEPAARQATLYFRGTLALDEGSLATTSATLWTTLAGEAEPVRPAPPSERAPATLPPQALATAAAHVFVPALAAPSGGTTSHASALPFASPPASGPSTPPGSPSTAAAPPAFVTPPALVASPTFMAPPSLVTPPSFVAPPALVAEPSSLEPAPATDAQPDDASSRLEPPANEAAEAASAAAEAEPPDAATEGGVVARAEVEVAPGPAPPAETGLRAEVLQRVRERLPLAELRLAGADLSGLELSGAHLQGLKLEGVVLRGARLVGARLADAKLVGADLTGALLDEADLSRADCTRVALDGARLARASLDGATLARARGKGLTLSGATLVRASLAHAELDEASLDGCDLTACDLTGASLVGASLVGARAPEALFEDANLERARLDGAGLGGARLAGARLDGASLVEADLAGAGLERASLVGACLARAKLRGASLERATLSRASFEGADLREANLQRASGEDVDFSRADASGADARHTKLTRARFRDAKLVQLLAPRAELVGAELGGADLRQANLRQAKLRESSFDDSELSGADLRDAELDRCRLSGARREGARLQGSSQRDTT